MVSTNDSTLFPPLPVQGKRYIRSTVRTYLATERRLLAFHVLALHPGSLVTQAIPGGFGDLELTEHFGEVLALAQEPSSLSNLAQRSFLTLPLLFSIDDDVSAVPAQR